MPTREIYWNVSGHAWIYLFAIVAAGFWSCGIYRRVRLWRLGGPAARLDRLPERAGGLLAEVFGQRRQLRDAFAGVAHLLIFYGFMGLLVATALIAVQEWTGSVFLRGRVYLAYSLAADACGILVLVGIGLAAYRRAVVRPAHVHSRAADWIALGLLLLVVAQGFLVEGARLAATELREDPGLAWWSPGGYAVALLLQDLEPERLLSLHRLHWWLHALVAFVFLGSLAYGRLDHLFYGALNILFRDLDSTSGARLPHPDVEAAFERDREALELGVGRIEAYSWKSLLDLDACMQCGRCEAVCPAHLSGAALSPRKLIRDLAGQLSEVGPVLARRGPDAERGLLPPLVGEPTRAGLRAAVLEEELWGCRTCGACQRECPVRVEHVPTIVGMRRHLAMTESRLSDAAQGFLRNLDERMHPWVGASRTRDAWYSDLAVKVLGRGERGEYLFWAGCTGALVERNVEVTRAVAKVLQAAGVDFAVLGSEEVCTGDPARRVGAELAFQTCAKQNIETLERYGVNKVVATCPHCFNTLRNEYPELGGRYEVVHHTELIRDLVRGGRLKLGPAVDSLTYHDPCYLGRHNGVYDAPREILARLVAPGGFEELPRSRSRSLCCGAGGGHAWMDEPSKRRVNQIRFEEVRSCGARTAAVSCPFCLQMFQEAAEVLDPAGVVRTVDVAELVAESLEADGAA